MPHDPEDVEVYGKSTDCFCPRCRKVHKMKINFIGRGMPRKYCVPCKDTIKDVDPVHAVEYHRPRIYPGFVPGN